MTEQEPQKGSRRNAIQRVILEKLKPAAAGPGSVEKIIDRVSAARSRATKESNRFLVLSLLFTALYIVKLMGLRADLVLFDQKIFQVPYGIFLFCVAAQLMSCMSVARSSDARVFDRYLKAVCEHEWPEQATIMYRLIPNESSWTSATSESVHSLEHNHITRLVFTIAMLPSIILAMVILFGPIMAGVYYLVDWKNEIQTGDINIQYYGVLFFTIVAAFWSIMYLFLHFSDTDEV